MTLTLGAHHACSAPTTFTIAKPLGLVIALSSIPNYVPRDVFSPVEYHGLGRINLGNSLGWLVHEALSTPSQLVYPLPDELTLLRVSPVQGMSVGIDEIVRPAAVTFPLASYDRNPTHVSLAYLTTPASPLAQTTVWTYTVPTGKKLYVARATLSASRVAAATGAGYNYLAIQFNGANVAFLEFHTGSPIGQRFTDEWGAGGMVLPAGTVVSSFVNVGETGGTVYVTSVLQGYTFDA